MTSIMLSVFGRTKENPRMKMRRLLFGISLALACAFPALGQDKEQDRVENAGKVMQEILAAPDSIPQSVLDKADCVVVLPSVLKFAIGIGDTYAVVS
jgi:SH3 domain-containing YSC84-like protein 1